jgi:hypothetical protein
LSPIGDKIAGVYTLDKNLRSYKYILSNKVCILKLNSRRIDTIYIDIKPHSIKIYYDGLVGGFSIPIKYLSILKKSGAKCVNKLSSSCEYLNSLTGWRFTINSNQKSYLLINSEPMYNNIYLEGITHPICYFGKYRGYVISKEYRPILEQLGAEYIDVIELPEYKVYDADKNGLKNWLINKKKYCLVLENGTNTTVDILTINCTNIYYDGLMGGFECDKKNIDYLKKLGATLI